MTTWRIAHLVLAKHSISVTVATAQNVACVKVKLLKAIIKSNKNKLLQNKLNITHSLRRSIIVWVQWMGVVGSVGLPQPKWTWGVISLTIQMFTKQYLCSLQSIFMNFARIGMEVLFQSQSKSFQNNSCFVAFFFYIFTRISVYTLYQLQSTCLQSNIFYLVIAIFQILTG